VILLQSRNSRRARNSRVADSLSAKGFNQFAARELP
jgi:hypothetical protein